MMHFYGYGPMGGWLGVGYGLLGLIFPALFWILLIWAIASMVRSSRHGRFWDDHPRQTPLEILQERYARGEITKKEFEEMKKDLQK